MKNIRIFHLKIFIFLVGKFSVYLNRRVFVMDDRSFPYRLGLFHSEIVCLVKNVWNCVNYVTCTSFRKIHVGVVVY